jgi:hypothetical protein
MPDLDVEISSAEWRSAVGRYHDYLRTTDQSDSGDLMEFFARNFSCDSTIVNPRFGPVGQTFTFGGQCLVGQ